MYYVCYMYCVLHALHVTHVVLVVIRIMIITIITVVIIVSIITSIISITIILHDFCRDGWRMCILSMNPCGRLFLHVRGYRFQGATRHRVVIPVAIPQLHLAGMTTLWRAAVWFAYPIILHTAI